MSIFEKKIKAVRKADLFRSMKVLSGPPDAVVNTPDGPKLIFCSNDYLGLSNNTQLKKLAALAAGEWGVGAGASRLISGNTDAHMELEKKLAEFMNTDRAVYFPSGYQANCGVIGSIAGPDDLIFSDELCHASIVDGCRLSRAEVKIFNHSDTNHLKELLKSHSSHQGLKLIVTDAVFSMDGDISPIRDICNFAREFNAHVYLDEAHALGIMGKMGKGLAAKENLEKHVAVRIGTLGKAFGLVGAFAACSKNVAELIISKARSLLYTTAPPAMLARVATAAIDIVKESDDLRQKLKNNIELFTRLAKRKKIPLLESETPVQPVMTGSYGNVTEISKKLWDLGIFVQGIRPPTVKKGTERLRITISSKHSQQHIKTLVEALKFALKTV